MTIRVRIVCETGVVSLKDAIEKNVIDYDNNMITAKKGTSVCLASGLLDNNGKEIFEKDVLSDSSGRLFQVQYMRGAFFAISLDHNDQKAIPLFFLEINGIIPAIIVDLTPGSSLSCARQFSNIENCLLHEKTCLTLRHVFCLLVSFTNLSFKPKSVSP